MTSRSPLDGMVGLSVGGHLAYLATTEFELPVTGSLSTAGVEHQLIEYPGVGQRFPCDRRSSYPEAANNAWNPRQPFLAPS